MPKVYSDEEKLEIRERLHAAANASLLKNGVKKTTVDELVEAVGIPKGTFYLFYKSKEELLFEVILEYHERINNEMMTRCMAEGAGITVDKLTEIVVDGIFGTMNSCLRTIMVPEEVAVLMKKLPPEIVSKHLASDDELMVSMLKGFAPNLDKSDIAAIDGAFHGIFFACLYKDAIGKENFRESISLLTKGLLMQIAPGNGNK